MAIEVISQQNISIHRNNLSDLFKVLNISWVNPRINDFEYPFKEEFLGSWKIQVLRTSKKMKFEDIVRLCKEEGYEPANIYHVLNFVKDVENLADYKSLMAPGSLCIDDFEYTGCVVLSNEKNKDLKLGLGNWRGNKIGEYDILRVKKTKQ